MDELRTVLQSCLHESAISLPQEKLDQLTLVLFEAADKDCSGTITFDELQDELQCFPGVMENLTIRYCPVCAGIMPGPGLDSRGEEWGELTNDPSASSCPDQTCPK